MVELPAGLGRSASGLELHFEWPKGFAKWIDENRGLVVRYGVDLDEVVDAGYTKDGERHVFGALPFKTPVDAAAESDGTVVDLTNELFIPYAGTEEETGADVGDDLVIRAMTFRVNPEKIDDAGDTEGRSSSLLGFASLKAGEDAASKKDESTADDNNDVFGFDIRMPCDLPAHVVVDSLILGYGEGKFVGRAGHLR